jgi:hypothetical protein
MLTCETVRRVLSDYLDGELTPSAREAFEGHLHACGQCAALRDGTRNILELAADPRAIPVPAGFGERLRQRILLDARRPSIPLGIGGQFASPGDHMAYFWQNDAEFEAAVGFLEAGLSGQDHCVIFGHEQANAKVLHTLSQKGFAVEALISSGRLSVLDGSSTGDDMLTRIGGDFQRAIERGASAIRLLGNIGWGRAGWPADDDILRFEARVTSAARKFPCVIICMYDIASLPGRIVLRGAFQTHPLTLSEDCVHSNPHYVEEERFITRLVQ